jgi:hypothetical protein
MNVGKRGLKCRDVAKDLQGGVDIESYIETESQNCSMRIGQQAAHIVKVRNWSTLRIVVELLAECESPRINYAGGQSTWTEREEVPMRRLSDGQADRVMRAEVCCADKFVDQGIKMTVRCTSVDYVGTSSATFQLLLDATQ